MKKQDTKSELAMQHALLKYLGENIVGKPEGPFAIYDEQQQAVLVFAAKRRNVRHVSLTGNAADSLLRAALRMRAHFLVDDDGRVTCRVGEHEGTGESYAAAALKAITAHSDCAKSEGHIPS